VCADSVRLNQWLLLGIARLALTISVPLLLLLFASTHVVMATMSATSAGG